jgi:hypothetical protein
MSNEKFLGPLVVLLRLLKELLENYFASIIHLGSNVCKLIAFGWKTNLSSRKFFLNATVKL